MSDPFVSVPFEIARGGKLFSSSAIIVFIALKSHHPEYPPSLRRLVADTGLGSATVTKALTELAAKRVIAIESGGARRKLNRYRFLPKDRWDLLAVLAEIPKPRSKTGGRQKTVSLIEPEKAADCFKNRNIVVSKNETSTVSKNEKVLDLLVRSNIRMLPTRGVTNRCRRSIEIGTGKNVSFGHDHNKRNGNEKGGGDAAEPSYVAELQKILNEFMKGGISSGEMNELTEKLSQKFGVKTAVPKKRVGNRAPVSRTC